MDREQALLILKKHLHDDYTVKHCLALEAIMRSLARRFGGDPERWGMAGLMHDIDWDLTKEHIEEHSLKGAEILEAEGFDEDIIHAVKAHNERHGVPQESLMDKWLGTADNMTGLIIASALVQPDKKLSSVKPESVLKKFKDKRFAAGTDRERIRKCEEYGIPLLEFITLSLEAMREKAPDLGV